MRLGSGKKEAELKKSFNAFKGAPCTYNLLSDSFQGRGIEAQPRLLLTADCFRSPL
jgi:hypothetical protein